MRDYQQELQEEMEAHQACQKELNQSLSREARLRVQLQAAKEALARFTGGETNG